MLVNMIQCIEAQNKVEITSTDFCSQMEKAGILDVGVFSSFEVQLIIFFISDSINSFCPGSRTLTLVQKLVIGIAKWSGQFSFDFNQLLNS